MCFRILIGLIQSKYCRQLIETKRIMGKGIHFT